MARITAQKLEPFQCAGSFSSNKGIGNMSARHSPSGGLPDEIRRQMGSPAMTRYVRSLPSWSELPDNDDKFADLLAELDRVETRQASGARQR